MFNVDGKEFVFLVLIALVVLGPEKLPDLFRRLGKAYAEFRRLSEGFQEEFRKAVEEPTTQLKETGNLIRESADLRMPSEVDEADGDDMASEASNEPASNQTASGTTDTTNGDAASVEDVSNPTTSNGTTANGTAANGTAANGTGRYGVDGDAGDVGEIYGDAVDVGEIYGDAAGVEEAAVEASSDVSSGRGER